MLIAGFVSRVAITQQNFLLEVQAASTNCLSVCLAPREEEGRLQSLSEEQELGLLPPS